MLLLEAIDELTQEAAAAEDYNVASILAALCAAISEGQEAELSAVVQLHVQERLSQHEQG